VRESDKATKNEDSPGDLFCSDPEIETSDGDWERLLWGAAFRIAETGREAEGITAWEDALKELSLEERRAEEEEETEWLTNIAIAQVKPLPLDSNQKGRKKKLAKIVRLLVQVLRDPRPSVTDVMDDEGFVRLTWLLKDPRLVEEEPEELEKALLTRTQKTFRQKERSGKLWVRLKKPSLEPWKYASHTGVRGCCTFGEIRSAVLHHTQQGSCLKRGQTRSSGIEVCLASCRPGNGTDIIPDEANTTAEVHFSREDPEGRDVSQ